MKRVKDYNDMMCQTSESLKTVILKSKLKAAIFQFEGLIDVIEEW